MVKVTKSSTIMQSLTLIAFMESEKIPILKFSTSPDTWHTKNMLIISIVYTLD